MRLLLTIIFISCAAQCIAQTNGADPNELMRRVIARRLDARHAPLCATLHTMSTVDISNDNSLVAVIPDHEAIGESDGILCYDPELGTRVRINARRGTAASSGLLRTVVENFESLSDYFDPADDRIVLLNTSFPSPLAKDAFDHYRFELTGSDVRDGVPVYEIAIHPTSRLYPGFEGKLWITRATYDPVAMELSPTSETSIPFVRELHLAMRFTRLTDKSYQPEALEISGRGRVRVAAFGVAEPDVAFTMRDELTGWRVNVPMPDSIRTQPEPIVIADDASEAGTEYWSRRSGLESAQVATIEQSWSRSQNGALKIGVAPYIDYNRASGASLGLAPAKSFGALTLSGMGGYSFGLHRPIGEANAAYTFETASPLKPTIRAGAFSSVSVTTTGDRTYPRIMNSLVAATLHQDYYNFMRKDGWMAAAGLTYNPFHLDVTYERSQQFSIANNARWALLTLAGKEFPVNPAIEDGSYQTVQADLAWGRATPFLKITPVDAVDVRWGITGLFGEQLATRSDFKLIEGLLSVSVPMVETGYTPMTLTLLGAGGAGTSTLPAQYQFRLRTSAATFGKPGGLVSPPKGVYGGTEYLSLGAEFNLTDLPWRALGLPTYNGRGIELMVAGASAHYLQRHPIGYLGMGNQWYSEAGFALGRIPLFLTDIVNGRVDFRWGLGPLGQFGANFTLVAPL